jgi:protein arginine kinase
VAISSRVRLARNLMDHVFPPHLSREEEKLVRDEIVSAFRKLPDALQIIYLDKISPLEQKILLERNIISQSFLTAPEKAVVVSEDWGLSAMINEEEHLRLACMQSGLCLDEAFRRVDRLDNLLEDSLHYAAALDWGYLNTGLASTGTGLRASVMLHFQGLVMDGKIGWVLKVASELGLQVKGYWGEGDNSLGSVYQVSNQHTMGLSEQDILTRVGELVRKLADYERASRDELLKNRKQELEDQVFRALGVLKFCRLISSREAIELLSAVRLGVSMGLLTEPSLETVTALLILSQKSHIQKNLELSGDDTDNKLVDYTRAQLLRRGLEGRDV